MNILIILFLSILTFCAVFFIAVWLLYKEDQECYCDECKSIKEQNKKNKKSRNKAK